LRHDLLGEEADVVCVPERLLEQGGRFLEGAAAERETFGRPEAANAERTFALGERPLVALEQHAAQTQLPPDALEGGPHPGRAPPRCRGRAVATSRRRCGPARPASASPRGPARRRVRRSSGRRPPIRHRGRAGVAISPRYRRALAAPLRILADVAALSLPEAACRRRRRGRARAARWCWRR